MYLEIFCGKACSKVTDLFLFVPKHTVWLFNHLHSCHVTNSQTYGKCELLSHLAAEPV